MKTVIKWIFGVGSILIGIMAFTDSIVVGGVLFLIAGAFLIPPIFDKINGGGKISRPMKIAIPIIGIFAGMMAIGGAGIDDVKQEQAATEKKEKEEYAQLSPEQKDSIASVERIADSLKVANRKREAEQKRLNEIEARKKNTITAADLYASYDANEVSADENFKNKTFYVTGIVEDIKKDFMDDIYVSLKTGQMFTSVSCYFDDKKVAASLKKGQRVTFKGKCKGMIVTLVTMEDCEIAENL
jgi:hypothetical protein